MMKHSLGDGMVNKFTDEQLSRIITAHELGELVQEGYSATGYPCCINQAAYELCGLVDAYRVNPISGNWFDENYDPSWTTEEFIEKLTEQQFI